MHIPSCTAQEGTGNLSRSLAEGQSYFATAKLAACVAVMGSAVAAAAAAAADVAAEVYSTASN